MARQTRANTWLENKRKYEAIIKASEPKLKYESALFKAQARVLEDGNCHLEATGCASPQEVSELVHWLYDVFVKKVG